MISPPTHCEHHKWMTPEGSVIINLVIPSILQKSRESLKQCQSSQCSIAHFVLFLSLNWLNYCGKGKILVGTVEISLWKSRELDFSIKVERSVGRDWRDGFGNTSEGEIMRSKLLKKIKKRLMVSIVVVVVEQIVWWKIKEFCIE